MFIIPSPDLVEKLSVHSRNGLSAQDVELSRTKHGANVLSEGKRKTWISLFITQFYNPLIYILLVAAAIIFFVGSDSYDAFIISGVLLFNALVGTIQEGRTYNLIDTLKHFIKTSTIVLRDGKKVVVDDSEIVVGDIVYLCEGQRVPADGCVIEAEILRIDESILTGESIPVIKKTYSNLVPLSSDSIVYKGTYVMGGNGVIVITAVGKTTAIGTIQQQMEEIKTEIPLKRELERLSYSILLFIFALCGLLFGIGLSMGKPLSEMLSLLTALFICVVPEGLPVVLTLILVSNAYKLACQKVLIKNLQAVEALGRIDTLVIDKTGTLTRNEMVVSDIWTGEKYYTVTGVGYQSKGSIMEDNHPITQSQDDDYLQRMALAAELLNNAYISPLENSDRFEVKGDPTEAALYIFAQKWNAINTINSQEYIKKYEFPFDDQKRYHAGFYEKDDTIYLFVIGAPEVILKYSHGSDEPTVVLNKFLSKGLRAVALAMQEYHSKSFSTIDLIKDIHKIIESGINFVGFYGIQDAIRPEISHIITEAQQAGIRIIMATGDHAQTAHHVAQVVGIITNDEAVLQGASLDSMNDQQFKNALNEYSVFARVSPHNKLRIVQGLMSSGSLVAMTGDGINDAPALLAADIGIAMGVIGTEVAKQASDIILFDDSFENIIYAIKKGRHVFYTLRKVILYFFATNMGEILIILFGLLSGLPLPLTAAQILWLNLITDGFLDIALSTEPEESLILEKKWLSKKYRLVDYGLALKMMFIALPMGIASLVMFTLYYKQDLIYARTMTLVTMAMFQWFNAWNCRSETKSLFQIGLTTNRWLIAATFLVIFLQLCLVYIPFLQNIFKTVALTVNDWIMIIVFCAPIVVIEELRKLVVRRYYS